MLRVPLPASLLQQRRPVIEPLFLPWSGCTARCVFCGQERQTGTRAAPVAEHLKNAEGRFAELLEQGKGGRILAFYGGTFTALGDEDFFACLDFFIKWKERGLFSGARCSTRPGTVQPQRLAAMAEAGFSAVELGVQTFDSTALARCGRPYSAADVRAGAESVRAAGLRLGLQLMPGMPGVAPGRFLGDVRMALSLKPAFLRLYPCLVLEGTPLADWWRSGRYMPWKLDETVRALSQAMHACWQAGVPVIRTGLAEEPELAATVLAGPRHPALGQMVQSRALLAHFRAYFSKHLGGRLPEGEQIRLSASLQGLIFGQGNELLADYAAMGIYPESIAWSSK